MTSEEQIIQCWKQFIQFLNQHLEPDEVEAWVNKLTLVKYQPDIVFIGGINQFFCNWVRDRHHQLLRDKIYEYFSSLEINPDFQLIIQVDKEASTPTTLNKKKMMSIPCHEFNDWLNPQFKFETFVNGGNSDIAYAASRAVGENIKENKYNPLFICGDVGLGGYFVLFPEVVINELC